MIDLHIHTTHSDGSMNPIEILRKAETLGIKLLSFTDHNSVGAYAELKNADVRQVFSGNLIHGVEFTTTVRGQVVEILGYGFDYEVIEKYIENRYGNKKDYFQQEMHLIYSTYKERGIHLYQCENDFSVEKYGSGKRFVFEDLVRPENEKFFKDATNQKNMRGYLRGEIYNPESQLYVDYTRLLPSASEIVEVIHRAGGVAFLAHCFLYTEHIWSRLDEGLCELLLDGMEVWYPAFSLAQMETLKKFCTEKKIFMSGGSDFHGQLRPEISLGNDHIEAEEISKWVNENKEK